MTSLRVLGQPTLLAVAAYAVVAVQSGSATAQETLTYRFSKGDEAHYALSFRHRVKIRGAQPSNGVVTHSFFYTLKVRRVRQSGGASLSLKVTRTKFKGGARATEFDSSIPAHRRAARSNRTIYLFAAIATSNVRLGVKPTGQVTHFRLSSLGPEFKDERIKGYVKRSIEEIKDHAYLFAPGTPIAKGKVWNTHVPIRFVGGPLAGRTLFAEASLILSGVKGSGDRRQARYTVRSFRSPNLGLAEGSVRGVKMDLTVRKIKGTVGFAPAKGRLESYRFNIQARFRISMNGKMVHEQEMDEEVSLKRLSN